MHKAIMILALSTLVGLVAGCEGSPVAPPGDNATGTSEHPEQTSKPPASSGSNAQTAAAVLRHYYSAINGHDYAKAYALWWNNGKASGKTLPEFRKGFADTQTSHVAVQAAGRLEGAAGSTYITIPVAVTATLSGGETQYFAGDYVLRKASNIPGASTSDRHWHIYSANLQAGDPR